jgi:hypothetical protein
MMSATAIFIVRQKVILTNGRGNDRAQAFVYF